MQVRPLRADDPDDVDAWLDLRVRLWPESSREEHADELELVLGDPERTVVLVAEEGGRRLGFAEISLREWAEGCASRPVGYLEGWYVEPDVRGRGVGRALVESAERWLLARGVDEMASDADPENTASLAAHGRLGFREVGRAVLFAKRLER